MTRTFSRPVADEVELRPRDDVDALLERYRAVLDDVTWIPGARRFEVERVRRGLLRLQRRLALREALGIGSATDERERKHVELFLATLPPPVSRWVYALAIVAIACVARLFAAWIASTGHAGSVIADKTIALQVSDPTSVMALADAVGDAGVKADVEFGWALLLGATLLLMTLSPARRSADQRTASLAEEERHLFTRLGSPPPRRSGFALALRTTAAGAVLTLGVHLIQLAQTWADDGRGTPRLILGSVIVVAAVAWLVRLAFAWHAWHRDGCCDHRPYARERDDAPS
jgi:hypothetical protein